MKIHQIKNRFTGAVLFECEAKSIKDAVENAVEDGASLVGASLVRASLVRANLVRASLDGASLDGANLDGASLYGASLVGASLVRASLDGASLDGASLVRASLDGASLDGASLDGASLDGASLDGASLDGARDGKRPIVHITGLTYSIVITATHAKVGCKYYTFAEWRKFTAKQIDAMGGQKATDFYPQLLKIIDLFCGE